MKSDRRSRGVKAIFFDLDDTLYDYSSSSDYSKNKVFSWLLDKYPDLRWEDIHSSYEEIVQDAVKKEVEGSYGAWNRQKRFQSLLSRLGLKDNSLARRLTAIFAEARAAPMKPYPDTRDVLAKLGKRYVLGIITNGPSVYQKEAISALKLGTYFSHILISEEVGFRKPADEIFKIALSKVACHPEEAVMVGDNPTEDIEPAKRLGMGTVLLDSKDRFTKEGLMFRERPDHLTRWLTELLKLY
jgi:putative hydrolase of the HAD superfamily